MTLISQAAWLDGPQRQKLIDIADGDFETTDENYASALESARELAQLAVPANLDAPSPRETEIPGGFRDAT